MAAAPTQLVGYLRGQRDALLVFAAELDAELAAIPQSPPLPTQRTCRTGEQKSDLRSGQSHPHWLESLGFTRFSRN